MKAALLEAIADAESAEEITYHGFDGRLLSQSGSRSTYQFTLKTYWDSSDHARIVIKDLARTTVADARVISHEATSLMLVTGSVLPREYLAHLLLIEDKAWLLKKELQALSHLQETTAQFGAKTLGLIPVNSGTKAVRGQLGTFVPHPHQERAIARGRGLEKTIIVGPPGTGKTATLSDLICRYLRLGLSVLVVSHTNIATDNAFIRLVQAMIGSQKADLRSLMEQGLVIRAGEPRHVALREGTYRGLTVAWTRAKQKLIVIAHRKRLQVALPRDGQDAAKTQRLLWDLVEWAARAGCTTSGEYIDPDRYNEEQE